MKVLFLTTHPNLPSSRFRVYQFLDYLRNEGIDCEVLLSMPLNFYDKLHGSKKFLNKIIFQGLELACRTKHILSSNNYNIVFIQKNLLSVNLRLISFFLKNIKTNIIFDFDDAIYLNIGQRLPPYLRFLEDTQQVKKIIQKSKVVIAGNDNLKDFAYIYNNNVHVIPTSVDTDYFIPKKYTKKNDKVTLVWTGSYGSNKYINLLNEVISTLSEKYNLRLYIISNVTRFIDFSKFGKAEVIFKQWNLATEIEDLHQADIGLTPLDDTELSRNKCGLKNLMYMSCGIPVVATPVGANTHIIENGVNGFLANSEQDWIDKIRLLIEDEDLRYRFGLEGRKKVETEYSLKVNAPILKKILLEACQ